MLRRFRASAFVVLASVAALAQSEPAPTGIKSEIKVGDTTYKVVDKVVLSKAIVFRKPQNPKSNVCVVTRTNKNCRIPAGRVSYGILACDGAVSSTPETVAQTFGRVPGQYSPSLFASILGIYLSKKHSEGELEIVILACGPWIAVPVQQEGPLEGGVSFNFNRLSLSVSSGKRVAGFSLFGIETRPETYRIAGMNEAVIFVVPFKALDGLSIQKNEGSLKTQTENVHLLEGDFASGTYSARSGRYNEKIDRDVVPAWQPPVPVIIGRQ